MATRRDGEATYDHGAQFYKSPIHHPDPLADLLPNKSILQTWFTKDESQYQVAQQGMTAIAKQLSQGLNIVFNERVLKVSEDTDGLLGLHCESGRVFRSKKAFLSSPLPQSLDILSTSKIDYPRELDSIKYAKALVGLFEIDASHLEGFDFSYEEVENGNIFSISNQKSKRVSSKLALTVVMSPAWSEAHFDAPDEETLKRVQEALSQYIQKKTPDFLFSKLQLKKWRFSHPLSKYKTPYEMVGLNSNIILLGDAFGGASLPGAVRSALRVFDHLQETKS